jgi:threonine/homoserine/homoserine lactone efflux protein
MNSLLFYFLITVFIVNITPGPAMMFVLRQSQSHGVKIGLISALGVEFGVFIYVILTALGIGVIFKEYPIIYNVIQICGAIYLLYLSYQIWPRKRNTSSALKISAHGVFMRGVFINLTNPKIVLFFISLLPQFIPEGHAPEIFILYGLIFNIGGVLFNSLVAILSNVVTKWLKKSSWYEYVPPILFIVISIYSIIQKLA